MVSELAHEKEAQTLAQADLNAGAVGVHAIANYHAVLIDCQHHGSRCCY